MEGLKGLKILHVVRQFHPAIGGLENFVLSLARQQRIEGMDVRVVTLNRVFGAGRKKLARFEVVQGIPVHRIGFFGSYKYPIAFGVLRQLRTCDIVHVHGVDFFSDFLAIAWPFHQRPMVLSTHGGFFHTKFALRLKKFYFNAITRRLIRAYERVLASSNNDYDLFRQIAPSRTILIENGVDTEKFSGISSPVFSFNFAFLGRFSDNKRLDRLIACFRSLRHELPEAHLAIIGRTWDQDRETLEAAIADADLTGVISVHTDLEDTQVRKELACASFFITASEYEGFGIALVEAMSAGLLPIAQRIPSAEKIIETAGLGCLCEFTDPSQAAAEIASFVAAVREDHANLRSRAMAQTEVYAWHTVVHRFSQQYLSTRNLRERVILNVKISSGRKETAVDVLDSALSDQKLTNILFANAHGLNITHKNPGLQATLQRCLVLNDGVGVKIASFIIAGKPFTENLNGTDLLPFYFSNTVHQLRIFLVGGRKHVVELTASTIRHRFAAHSVVGWQHGYFPDSESASVCAKIKETGANVVLVAMGVPRQEIWIDRYSRETGAVLHFGVGGLFDFMSGETPRAPRWVRYIYMEWAFRLCIEPKRMWRRYLIGNFMFVKNVLWP